ncbi:GNAT family N-acetyltransferase [Microaerobacter geothermalis]|uniref:GNAT family N-acetyltransferase n=1 Tax=Microaerobacter geothermalis TaxID=674972 RepID=UPI001F279AC5|nr:GNAT family N-acetyltransferase [Microaerobacter geothermalis]MCF6094616.1 GNAT family N-acetyltransferase [Microaerobacter geothermalis]
MEIKSLNPSQFVKLKKSLLQFVISHGERKITSRAIQWIKELEPLKLDQPGYFLLIAAEEKKLLGLTAVANYGTEESFVVVHKRERQQGISQEMIKFLFQQIDKIYGRVSLDNIPSIKMCLSMGMVGFKLVEGPTGKPTMWFARGNWNPKDVE